jgi:hypothetical protein
MDHCMDHPGPLQCLWGFMDFQKLADKYEMIPDVRFSGWEDSSPTVELLNHLGSKDLGVLLVIKENLLCIHFEPGLGKEDDSERWEFADIAVEMLVDASEDLYCLLNEDKIKIRSMI